MKTKTKKTMFKIMALAFAVCLTLVSNAPNTAFAADTVKKITVSGEGKVYVKPDLAYLNLGVSSSNEDAKAAQDENNKIMTAVIAAVKAEGVDESDIQTTNYYMYQQRDYNDTDKVTYMVTNSVRITVRNITDAGTIIDKAITAGANQNNGISFGISDSEEFYNEALALAIKNADIKAQAIAKSISVKISGPSEIMETSGTYTSYLSDVEARSSIANAAMPIQMGDLTVSANVQVVYQY